MEKTKTNTGSGSSNTYSVDDELKKAITYHQAGELAKAEQIYRNILAVHPDHSDSLHLLGLIAKQSGNKDAALSLIKKAVENNPRNPVYQNNLGGVFIDLGEFEKAVYRFRFAIEIDPGNFEAHFNLGNAFRDQGNLDEAINCYREAARIAPDNHMVIFNLANALKAQGDIRSAEKNYRKVLSINPNAVKAYFELAHLIETKDEKTDIAALESIKQNTHLPLEDSVYLHFALGTLYAGAGDYDNAFENYRAGNEHRKRLRDQNFSFDTFKQQIDAFIEIFDEDLFKQKESFDLSSVNPVFIVGMPRSGTTLVEQILSSHPDIFGLGELPDMRQMENTLRAQYGGMSISQVIASFNPLTARALGEKYLGRIRSISQGAGRVTDKMPGNFLRLWLIALIFPGAKIIHCRRHPLDTCLSCYFTHFKEAHGFTNDLKILGHYYQQYERLMNHWHQVLPLPILDVDYEELVKNQEKISRKLVAFCDVNWDESCLKFYRNKRYVNTASALQVKQKIYRTSVGRWKNYEKYLSPLLGGLGR